LTLCCCCWRPRAQCYASAGKTGILAGNYGEAGALDLYGPALGLPPVIAGVNSFWLRGYPEPIPDTFVVVGFSRRFLAERFDRCDLAGRNANPYGVMNEEMRDHPGLYVCRSLRQPWPEFWKSLRAFG